MIKENKLQNKEERSNKKVNRIRNKKVNKVQKYRQINQNKN